MKKFWTLLKINWQNTFEYRADMIIWGLSWALVPFVGLAIWTSASANNPHLPYSHSEFAIYFLAVALINTLTGAWGSWFINEKIIDGEFSRYLIKPFSLTQDYLANNISEKVLKVAIVIPFVLLGGYLLHINLLNTLNLGFSNVIFFLISLCFAFMISFFIDQTIGLTGVWFSDIYFLNTTFDILALVFAGRLIPLALLPGLFQNLSIYLPFRYIISFPVEILLGKLTQDGLILGFTVQSIWLCLILVLHHIIFRAGSKVYEGYSG